MKTVWRRVYLTDGHDSQSHTSEAQQHFCLYAFNLNVLHFPSEHDNNI